MLMPTGLGVCSGASSTQVPSFLRDFSLIWLPLLNFFFLTLPATFDFFDFCLWLYYKDSSRSPLPPFFTRTQSMINCGAVGWRIGRHLKLPTWVRGCSLEKSPTFMVRYLELSFELASCGFKW